MTNLAPQEHPVKLSSASFPSLLPTRPYCSNVLCDGLHIRSREQALRHRHIQINGPSISCWLSFDIDIPGAYYASDDANVADPNVIVTNPQNGHAHLLYLLLAPVPNTAASHMRPVMYLDAVRRGYIRRLGADVGYCGLIVKNPLHSDWRAFWTRAEPYSLEELDGYLFPRDKAFIGSRDETSGLGRNCTIFNALRKVAYREARTEISQTELFKLLNIHGQALNAQFQDPLGLSEIRAIAKSVAKWVSKRFSMERFREVQSMRVRKRWEGHTPLSDSKPWEDEGISRRTWFRRRSL